MLSRYSVRKSNTLGFTLLEVMVVVFLIALASSLAVPYVKKYIKDSQKREFVQDLFGLVTAFRSYYLINNEWPRDLNPNRIPGEVAPFLPDKFRIPVSNDGVIYTTSIRPFGYSSSNVDDSTCAWDWENWFNSSPGYLRISIRNIPMANLNDQERQSLEKSIDDGSFSAGTIIDDGQAGARGFQYIFKDALIRDPGP